MTISAFLMVICRLPLASGILLVFKVHVDWAAEVGRRFKLSLVFNEEGVVDSCVLGADVINQF